MANDNNTHIMNNEFLKVLPFYSLTNYSLSLMFESATVKYNNLLKRNNFEKYLENASTKEMRDLVSCQYYDENSFNMNFNTINSNCSIIHINLQSSRKKPCFVLI